MRRIECLLVLIVAAFLFSACGDSGPSLISNNKENNENNENNANNSGLKPDGSSCVDASECASNSCYIGVCSSASCIDGVKNGDESDVDCGTIGCVKCDVDKACDEDLDCRSGICNDNVCQAQNCGDGLKNGLETDVDCGGLCGPCDDGKGCAEISDCVSNVCENDVCATPTCDDGEANGTETDVDCGGPCEPCDDNKGCSVAGDCVSGVCGGSTCSVPTCTDSVQNANETDVDCGGRDCGPCADTLSCDRDDDCISQVCDGVTDTCSAPTCTDGETNGNETDTDCGGPDCVECDPGDRCAVGTDCVSGICDAAFECTRPSCEDNVQNAEETDVDCGGDDCEPCDDNDMCQLAEDCLSRVCSGNVCQAGQCNDGQFNGNETDVDCGGNQCAPCADTLDCNDATDCVSGVCTSGSCRAPTCSDGVENGLETDVDCGGDCPNACADFQKCDFGSDCISLVCRPDTKTCETARCDDNVQNSDETDVDCGGSCPFDCELGDTCVDDMDCDTMICDGGPIGPICAACNENATQLLNTRCGYANRGRVQQTCTNGIWVNSSCEEVWYGACKEILSDDPNALDGSYDIDPDGPDPLYDEFEVFCDMSTNGGGWTQILACTAKDELRGEMVGIDQADDARFERCLPRTQDEGSDNHTYHYSFDFPSGFTQFRFDDYEARAYADGDQNHTSDLGFIQTNWNTAASSSVNRGDISFGSAGGSGPVTSFSRKVPAQDCTDCTIQWPTNQNGPYNIGATSNKFRIGWGEAGPQTEGWYPWWDGAIYLR